MKNLKSCSLVRIVFVHCLCLICLGFTTNVQAYIAPPPLRLISFNARNAESAILLEWRTVGENNTDYFNVEQSIDGITFTKVGSMKAAGVDPLNRSYSFKDLKPINGNNYYRLAMYDLDGTVRYSATNIIKAETIRRLRVLPNPVINNAGFNIYWNSNGTGVASVTIYGLSGAAVYKGRLAASGKTTVGINNWPAGVYCIALDDGIRKEFSKIIVSY